MTRVRINADPMPQLIANALLRVNTQFSNHNAVYERQERIWNYKREIAKVVVAGGEADEPFRQEAEARGISVADLAQLVLSKEDKSDAYKYRELERQKALLRLESCKTKSELDAMVAQVLDITISGR